MDAPPAASQQSQSQSQLPRNTNDSKRVEPSDPQTTRAAFKLPKRKRLVKACDPCHKSKRRCDGTAPCSNCYFASKECTYTDSTGRPVPAPNASRTDIILNLPTTAHSPTNINVSAPDVASGSYHPPESVVPKSGIRQPEAIMSPSSAVPGPSAFISPHSSELTSHRMIDDAPQDRGSFRSHVPGGHTPPRKRLRNDSIPNQQTTVSTQLPSPSSTARPSGFAFVDAQGTAHRHVDGTIASGDFRKDITLELVSLFFAHCHPHRLIIHSASFHADLCRGRVPPFLLNAICAVAAPLSQNPRIRVTPVRESGRKFADAALGVLFDAEGQLVVTGVDVAQALVLIQTYNVYRESRMQDDLRLYDLALRILRSLRVLEASNNTADSPSLSSDERYALGIQRESARRTFWLIHTVELLGAVFTQRPTIYTKDDLASVRLPCDEASFDLALEIPHDFAEYLDTLAVKTSEASEFGHIVRIATILLDIERTRLYSPDLQAMLSCEKELQRWSISLADHLKYSPENLQAQLSLWESGCNTGTWCYCFVHILNACAVLALSSFRRRLGQGPCRDHDSALAAFSVIIKALGPRARNSILMGCVLWMQYCGPHASNYNSSSSEARINTVDTSIVSAQSSEEGAPANVPAPGMLPQLNEWIKDWEELWGPARMHVNSNAVEADFEARRPVYQEEGTTAVSATAFGLPVPDVVIDPALRSSEERSSSTGPQLSPSLSTTSTLRGRDPQSLPSLKSSGLLEIFAEDPFGNRSSGASTPVKPSWPLSISGSPRPPPLPLGLPIGSSGSRSNPASPQPHSPTFHPSHGPQTRLQAPSFHQFDVSKQDTGIIPSSSHHDGSKTLTSQSISSPRTPPYQKP